MDDKELHNVILGSDIPGSTVQMLVQDPNNVCLDSNELRCTLPSARTLQFVRWCCQGAEKTVELIRMDSMKLANHRRIFEYFNDIKFRIKVWNV